jgi:hypothetical protein
MSASDQSGLQPYVFDAIYKATGGPGKPIHTPERFASLRAERSLLLDADNRKAVFRDLFGKQITVTLRNSGISETFRQLHFRDSEGMQATLKLGLPDRIYIVAQGVVALASQRKMDEPKFNKETPYVDPSEILKMHEIQRRCPFYLNIEHDLPEPNTPFASLLPYWKKMWEQSQLRRDLTAALETHASKMRPIRKIVCFGLGCIVPEYERSHVQHLAASHIAKVLGKAQKSDKEIEVFAQDPIYSRACIEVLLGFDPPIKVVDFSKAEGLAKVDEHTLIISINPTGTVIEPALDLTRDKGGPAGILQHAWTVRAERKWKGKVLKSGEGVEYDWDGGSCVEWAYKDKCVKVEVSDDEWFGHPWNEDMCKIDTELLYVERSR